MKYAGLRLASFHKRPPTYTTSAVRQAHAGFFYTGQDDMVECFKCHLQVSNWAALGEPVDPFAVHMQRSSDCPFIVDNDKENIAFSVNPAAPLKPLTPPPSNLATPLQSLNMTSQPLQQLSNTTNQMQNRASLLKSAPRYLPNYRNEQQRLDTFTYWPNTSAVRPAELARAGFYYLGTEDRVQCAFCKGVLRNWEPDDHAFEKHKRRFPQCPYVRDVNTSGNIPIKDQLSGVNLRRELKNMQEVRHLSSLSLSIWI